MSFTKLTKTAMGFVDRARRTRVKFKFYKRPVYGGEQISLPIPKGKRVFFDANVTIPKDMIRKFGSHLESHPGKYTILGGGIASYVGSKLAQRNPRRRSRRRTKRRR